MPTHPARDRLQPLANEAELSNPAELAGKVQRYNQPQVLHTSTGKFTDNTCFIAPSKGLGPGQFRRAAFQRGPDAAVGETAILLTPPPHPY